jgi:hypothetical protein
MSYPPHREAAELDAERALADDLAADVVALRQAIFDICEEEGLQAPEIAFTDASLARHRKARQQ